MPSLLRGSDGVLTGLDRSVVWPCLMAIVWSGPGVAKPVKSCSHDGEHLVEVLGLVLQSSSRGLGVTQAFIFALSHKLHVRGFVWLTEILLNAAYPSLLCMTCLLVFSL